MRINASCAGTRLSVSMAQGQSKRCYKITFAHQHGVLGGVASVTQLLRCT
jgi:hypothetical protein